MILSDRLRSRMAERGLSQSELARRVGVSQATIYKLVSGGSYGSKHLHRVARELGTTTDYLEGLIEDPDEGAPPPPPPATVQVVSLPVLLPSQPALAAMFRGLLQSVEALGLSTDELADELATLLPIGLGQIKGRLRYVENDEDDEQSPPAEGRSTADERPPRARRS